ncbi:pyridoxamine 5'-phosphate oxidase family protein [Prosthecomicrobium pneumaticum]|uniref:General stress protein 26 n=1 Tax=Prosthecomicrobium pneumaticum TaxID=81895 RepID=A0A7W9FLH2_9HYPH|nr:pyridoxamine 5'-phosphate oxidase family protein [Prosthecomicrobium pneumaticum]MBB5752850.1 general stress protein 26 [Prosthecomicrobium pneumaticum]
MMENAEDGRAKVKEILDDAGFVMLATRSADGRYHARPMAVAACDEDGVLWFLTDRRSIKADELARDSEVLVTVADESHDNYLSLGGTASLQTDRPTIDRLWSEPARAWFPNGKDDPGIAALRIDIDIAEYWDVSSSTLVQLYGYAKAVITGERAHTGEASDNATVRF